ncbi:MAG: methylglutamate dehydrogenase subunit [Hyphomicrobiales bacterium]|nr:methylglutamate dehydrogenase subunit [Hyphomicrobiales bacterium]
MSAPFRLASGGLIDRGKPLSFSFDGKTYNGFAGDTLASALIANGVKLVSRSFKYHRPRGILTAGSEEPNALVELRSGARREPNTRATVTELYDGLVAASQNRWPSLALDVSGINDLLSPFLAAGFYYKTFMWPAKFWEALYEPLIRRAAGLGRVAGAEDPDTYEKAFAHCDVLVIGAGPAGLMAALAAGRAGARVILADEDFRLGGRLLAERHEIDGRPGAAWAAGIEAELSAMPEVRIMHRTTVLGVYDHGQYSAVERVNDHVATPPIHEPRQRSWKIVAKRAVLAAGALERPIAFGNNDRPGVMLAGAARAYINRYAATPGKRLAVFTNNDDGWRTAADARTAGIEVVAVVDSRAAKSELSKLGFSTMSNSRVSHVDGKQGVRAIDVVGANGRATRIECDALAVSGGWNPAVHLTCHLGGKPVWNDEIAAFVPGTRPPAMYAAGATNGAFTLSRCLTGGIAAGAMAAGDCGFDFTPITQPRADDEPAAVTPLWHVKESRAKAFVDFQNDVTAKDIALAHQEGFGSVEHLKRYTTLGMATDQGKTANVTGLAILAEASGRAIPQVGTTTYRPPYVPVSFGAMAGHHRGRDFRPIRLPPSHAWATEQGAVFMETGAWLRAQYYPRAGETDWLQSVNREVAATRASVGVCDVSTFGKVAFEGPDAAAFLDRVCANTLSTLPVGKARYALMLREDGFVQDDGTVARLGPEYFVMTSTTANAPRMMQHLEFCHQVLWPALDVGMVSVSEQWAQFAVAGPRSRDVLCKLIDADIANAAFPYLGAREVSFGGVSARLFRLSFSGELAYELAVPARYGDAVIRAIMAAGAEFAITPYGIEALGVMRTEKGHVAGQEMNGQLTARDLGLGRMMSTRKDYIGRVMAQRPALLDPERPAFVGLRPVERSARLRAGAHFIPVGAAATIENDEGYMTSVAFSPTFGHWIGLGVLKRGPERIGQRVRAYDPVRNGDVEVEVCSPHFFDPEGARLHA